jgi:Protein of unknown function (DUF1566)
VDATARNAADAAKHAAADVQMPGKRLWRLWFGERRVRLLRRHGARVHGQQYVLRASSLESGRSLRALAAATFALACCDSSGGTRAADAGTAGGLDGAIAVSEAQGQDSGDDGAAGDSGDDVVVDAGTESISCPGSADGGDDSGYSSLCSTGVCVDANWAEWPMPNSSVDVAMGAPNLASYTIIGDGTVTDDVTGLMWQQAPPSISYTWADAQAYCTSLTLGGHGDWRLATYIELISIVDYSHNLPAMDPTAFPGAAAVDVWSATPLGGLPTNAREIYFMAGDSGSDPMTGGNFVRCARGPAAASSPAVSAVRYMIANDTVYDTKTKLTWQQTAPSGTYAWADARSYCASLTLNGAGGWRLPTAKELLTIADVTKSTSPAIDCSAFPGARANISWSATSFAGFTPSTPFAWAVRFDSANPVTFDVSSLNSVRCVR